MEKLRLLEPGCVLLDRSPGLTARPLGVGGVVVQAATADSARRLSGDPSGTGGEAVGSRWIVPAVAPIKRAGGRRPFSGVLSVYDHDRPVVVPVREVNGLLDTL